MKKVLVVFLAIITTLCMAFGFAGCSLSDVFGGNESGKTDPPVVDPSGDDKEQDGEQKPDEGEESETPAPHVHSFGEWKVTKEATCKTEGTKERECSCGEKETAVYRAGHDFENMVCRWCGTKASLGLEYTLINEDKEYEVSGLGDCTDTDLVITSSYDGKPVTSIGYQAFEYCSGLNSVIIPDGVTSIGMWAFTYCSGLTGELNIPDSVTSIGYGAFGFCSGLPSVTIGKGVISIEGGAFEYCSGLTSITIPDSVTSIGSGAFKYCEGLTSITIPDSVTSIGSSAFTYTAFKLISA